MGAQDVVTPFVYKSVGAQIEDPGDQGQEGAPPGEGEDLLDVHCITLEHQMALPMSYIYIPWVGHVLHTCNGAMEFW